MNKRDEEIIDCSRMMIPLGLMPCISETMDNENADENHTGNAAEFDDDVESGGRNGTVDHEQ